MRRGKLPSKLTMQAPTKDRNKETRILQVLHGSQISNKCWQGTRQVVLTQIPAVAEAIMLEAGNFHCTVGFT